MLSKTINKNIIKNNNVFSTVNILNNDNNYNKQSSRNMAENPNDIKKRIDSTVSVAKITKSMKMVSAAKLKHDEKRLADGKVFGSSFESVFGTKQLHLEEYQLENQTDEDVNVGENPLIFGISSDRGLCGGVNSFASKLIRLRASNLEKSNKSPKIVLLGAKGEGQLRRTNGEQIVASADEISKTPINFGKASLIAQRVMEVANANNCDQIDIVFNKYKSVIAYDTTLKALPNFATKYINSADDAGLPAPLDEYDIEPELATEALSNFVEFSLASAIYGAFVENATSEQSARMTAMDNATSNAEDMVEKLTVRFNRSRQAKITTELTEIISGAESLND